MEPLGIYVHIPFCRKKCDYCDFYSVENGNESFDAYVLAVCKGLEAWSQKLQTVADTLYIGGGTPSLLGAQRLGAIIGTARERFGLKNAEITVECNPSTVCDGFFDILSEAGVNRVSLGLQSAIAQERASLGRLSKSEDAERAVISAKRSGIDNISLDVMLGIPGQTEASLKKTADFCFDMGARHISAYILKVEENTPLAVGKVEIPGDEIQAELYLRACELFERHGFFQYEISNFSKPDYESRHNLKYWNMQEYLGIGAAAHSFIKGERFYYPRSIDKFLKGCEPVSDGHGGDFEEYCMLRLRLSKGISEDECMKRFGHGIPAEMIKKAEMLKKHFLLNWDGGRLCLTRNGFLLSNSVIAELLN